jgi:hypothetical protein
VLLSRFSAFSALCARKSHFRSICNVANYSLATGSGASDAVAFQRDANYAAAVQRADDELARALNRRDGVGNGVRIATVAM